MLGILPLTNSSNTFRISFVHFEFNFSTFCNSNEIKAHISYPFILGTYFSFDLIWRSGVQCKVAGALSVLSSEVSVLMLTVITADRLLSIVFAFRCSRLTLRGTYIICAVVWLCGTAIAVVPAFDTPYFFNEERRYGFYGKDCSALSYLAVIISLTVKLWGIP